MSVAFLWISSSRLFLSVIVPSFLVLRRALFALSAMAPFSPFSNPPPATYLTVPRFLPHETRGDSGQRRTNLFNIALEPASSICHSRPLSGCPPGRPSGEGGVKSVLHLFFSAIS